MNFISHLECSECGTHCDADQLQTVCQDCRRPLLARYDLKSLKNTWERDALYARPGDMWRYRELLPVQNEDAIVKLGEGHTPLLQTRRLGLTLGMPHLFIKDESANPTGSFKARGLCVAVSRARELGVKEVAIPSAGNAAGALSAYAARAGIQAHVFMPHDIPPAFVQECTAFGAQVVLVPGTIADCGREVQLGAERNGWFVMSTLWEPYRLEGKKTMGFELAEQLNWRLPDVIIYPTGGGTGLIGIWKAFDELEQLGWIDSHRPRMVSVQAEGCSPIVRAFQEQKELAATWEDPHTVALGLCVPSAIGDRLMLGVLRHSGGTAIAVPDAALAEGQMKMSRLEGIHACPEGGATVAALERLLQNGWISSEEFVVLFNTAAGSKYPPPLSNGGMAIVRPSVP